MKATDLRELDGDGLRGRVAELEDEVFRCASASRWVSSRSRPSSATRAGTWRA